MGVICHVVSLYKGIPFLEAVKTRADIRHKYTEYKVVKSLDELYTKRHAHEKSNGANIIIMLTTLISMTTNIWNSMFC